MEYKDYYKILGVARNADEQEIKKAYRKLAQQYHPDKNKGDQGAEQKFKEINEAHTVLSDKEKRGKYDRFGSQWEQYERMQGGPPPGGRGRHGGMNVSQEELDQILRQMGLGGFGGARRNAGGPGDNSTFFDALFGGSFQQTGGGFDPRGGGRGRPQARPKTTTEVAVSVTLEEAFHGATRTLESSDGGRFEVSIPRGVKSGSKVRIREADSGTILLKVTVRKHPKFRREGDDLHVPVQVDLLTAVLGGEVQVETLERPVVLTIPAGTPSGKSFRLRGHAKAEIS